MVKKLEKIKRPREDQLVTRQKTSDNDLAKISPPIEETPRVDDIKNLKQQKFWTIRRQLKFN